MPNAAKLKMITAAQNNQILLITQIQVTGIAFLPS